jgi:hypothetical protein
MEAKHTIKLIVAGAIALSLLTTACTVPTIYSKEVKVTKDAQGRITQTEETERVTQPQGKGHPVKFDHLKGVDPNEK